MASVTQGVTQTAANASTNTTVIAAATTSSMTLFDWASSNSILIGVVCTVTSLVVAVVFHVLNFKLNEKHKRIDSIVAMKRQGLNDKEIEKVLKMSESK